jgi:ATP-dependent protease ClpP protease subunit
LLAGPIVEEMVPYVAEYLAATTYPVIYIDSPGGSMNASLEIAAGIQAHGNVKCIVRGLAGSGAFGVLQACRQRVVAKSSRLMTHQPRVGVNVPLDLNLANFVASEVLKSTLRWNSVCASRLKMTPVEYAARVNGKDWLMTADEAVAVGAADSVL